MNSKHTIGHGISQLALIAGHVARSILADNQHDTADGQSVEIVAETLMDATSDQMDRGQPGHATELAIVIQDRLQDAVSAILDAQGAEMITLQDSPSGISAGVYVNGFGILPYVRAEDGRQRVSLEGLANIGAEHRDIDRVAGLAPQLFAADRLSFDVGQSVGLLADLLSASQPVADAYASPTPKQTLRAEWRQPINYEASVAFSDRSDRATWPSSPFRNSTPSNRTIANAAHLAGERLQCDGYAIERRLIEIRNAVFPDKTMVYSQLGEALPGAVSLLARALKVSHADVGKHVRNPLESLFERQGVKFLEGPQIVQLLCAQINAEYGRSGAAGTDNHVAIAKEICGELVTLDAASRITGFSVAGIRNMAATMTTGVEYDQDGAPVRIRVRSLIRFIQREREHLAQTTAEMAEQLGAAQDDADKAYQRGRDAFLEPFKRAAETLRTATVKTSTPSTPNRKG